jgi:hypothetical protein
MPGVERSAHHIDQPFKRQSSELTTVDRAPLVPSNPPMPDRNPSLAPVAPEVEEHTV